MATQLASTPRQPFAPLNSSRLSNLVSLKNRQNALTTLTSPSKRKATTFDFDNASHDDAENIDPSFLSPKRSKAQDGSSKDTLSKPVNYFLTRAPPTEFSSAKVVASPNRPILTAKSPAPRLDISRKATPLSAPAGRSPTRKRIGILNRRKTGSPFTRIDPPKFSTPSASSGLSFSIDAALSGTIPSYTSRATPTPAPASNHDLPIPVLHTAEPREGWFFSIYEDTEEELATNLMEHGACTLDISSDEENAARERDMRGKENVPPMDDVSQTRTVLSSSTSGGETVMGGESVAGDKVLDAEKEMEGIKARMARASRKQRQQDENAIELDRSPLGDLAAKDFYAEGCDASATIIVASEESEHTDEPSLLPELVENNIETVSHSDGEVGVARTFDFELDVVGKGKGKEVDIDALMAKGEEAPKAGLLCPMEPVAEGWSVWESGSDKGDE